MHKHMYIYIYIHNICTFTFTQSRSSRRSSRRQHRDESPGEEMGGAPRNPAARNHFSVWIVKPSGCHCTDGHLASRVFTEDQQIS